MRLFLDSSALVKKYLLEPGSTQVIARCGEAEEVLLSVIALPEALSTLNRGRREGRVSESEYVALKAEVLADTGQATVIEITPAVVERTIACLEQSPVRTLDAIHVATVMETSPDLFLTGDRRQYKAAKAMGLKVEGVGL